MQPKFFISKYTYSSSDWHDWEERYETVKVDGKYFFNEDEVLDIIWNDMLKHISISDTSNVLPNLKYRERKAIYHTEEEYCHFDVIKENRREYTLDIDSYWSTCSTYHINRVTNPKYTPIRRHICAPKYSPGGFKIECGHFDTYAEAEEALKTMPAEVNCFPYHSQELDIIVENEETIINDKMWGYAKRLIKYREESPTKYYETYVPFYDKHLEKLEKEGLI